MFGRLWIPLVIFVAAMLGIALILNIRNAGRRKRDDTENVVDLGDRFNRARYMNEDGNS